MYLNPPMSPTIGEILRNPIDFANLFVVFWPIRNIKSFFKRRYIVALLALEIAT